MRRTVRALGLAAREEARAPGMWKSFAFGLVWLGVVLAASFVDDVGRSLEARYSPVVMPAALVDVRSVPGGVEFGGETTKLRDCAFDHVNWYELGEAGRRVKLVLTVKEGPKVRAPGKFVFGPWFLPISADTLLFASEAFAVHSCHAGWQTESRLWEAKRRE